MTIGFAQKIKGQPTHFVEKIWEGLLKQGMQIPVYEMLKRSLFNEAHYKKGTRTAKIHTIRVDAKNRWKAGDKMHMVINNRTKDRFQFAPVVECTSVQDVCIMYSSGDAESRKIFTFFGIYVDKKDIGTVAIFSKDEIEYTGRALEFIQNDGFEDAIGFCDYFKEDFEGKIIHWTDEKY